VQDEPYIALLNESPKKRLEDNRHQSPQQNTPIHAMLLQHCFWQIHREADTQYQHDKQNTSMGR
jgi:hypothetical protein